MHPVLFLLLCHWRSCCQTLAWARASVIEALVLGSFCGLGGWGAWGAGRRPEGGWRPRGPELLGALVLHQLLLEDLLGAWPWRRSGNAKMLLICLPFASFRPQTWVACMGGFGAFGPPVALGRCLNHADLIVTSSLSLRRLRRLRLFGLRPRLRRLALCDFRCFGLLFSARSAERSKTHDSA